MGITLPKDLLDAMPHQGAKEVYARNLKNQEGGNQILKIIKVKLCKVIEADYELNERIVTKVKYNSSITISGTLFLVCLV